MYIKSITLENFLPFQGKQHIEFSTDEVKNVTLVMGDNGSGKTSLMQAFEWCLYGIAPEDSPQIINAYVRDHIVPGSYRYASVAIDLEKGGTLFHISRKQKYSRRESGILDKPDKQEFVITFKDGGETKQIALADQSSTINKLLSNRLSHYFFFDGEHVKKMRAEIERGKSSDFADAVKSILGFQSIASALGHLKSTGNKASVERWFMRQFDSAGNQDQEEKQKRIDTLRKMIDRNTREKDEAEDDRDAAKQNVERYQQLLRDNAESEEAQKAVDKAKRNHEQAKASLVARRDAYFKLFRKQHHRFFVERMIRDAQNELIDQDVANKGVPNVDDATIKFILKRGECICGTKFSAGDDVAKHLYELLEYVPPKSLGTYISEFNDECHIRTEGELTFYDEIVEAFNSFRTAEQSVASTEKALESAQAYLASLPNIDVGILRTNLAEAERDYDRAVSRVDAARRSMNKASEEIKRLNEEIKSYSVKSQKNQEVRKCLAYVEFIYQYLDDFYRQKETVTRARLCETVNKFFTRMYDGQIHLELDENYGVTVKVDDIEIGNDAWRTSSGQTLAIILAFILGILEIAKELDTGKDSLLIGDTYPLVMDAPLSDFDKTRIGTICNLLPTVAEQVIIFIKDTDGELAEHHMKDYIGRRYTIGKISDVESAIKE